jgi:hypothetical protein
MFRVKENTPTLYVNSLMLVQNNLIKIEKNLQVLPYLVKIKYQIDDNNC